jgi:hypothetical protein
MLERGAPRPDPHAAAVTRYAHAVLHVPVQITPWTGAAALPVYVRTLYTLYAAQLGERACVLFKPTQDIPGPLDIAKHAAVLARTLGQLTIYTTAGLSAYQRTHLTRLGVPFIVPDNQFYVPALAIDLRERFQQQRAEHRETLTPAAQAVLFHHILRRRETTQTPSAIARDLNHTPMTAGRAFETLAAAGLAVLERHGKEKRIQFPLPRRALFEAAKDRLITPVRSLKHVRGPIPDHWIEAGESAFAARTDLARPPQRCVAVDARAWRDAAWRNGLAETAVGEGETLVETWAYDPARLTDTRQADPLSLYVQFHGASDERLAMAAEQLLEQVPW